jgi:hypothetical protein
LEVLDVKHTYEVVVGNIGSVYTGTRKADAMKHFREYKRQSETGYGRAADEEITLFADGELALTHEAITAISAYVGSAWYRDCDPFMCVAFNPRRYKTSPDADKRLGRMAMASAKDDYDSAEWGESKQEFLDSVCMSGVHYEKNVELTAEQRRDFYRQGYCFFDGL